MLIGDISRHNARRYPGKLAVISEGRQLSWAAVDERANRLATYLQGAGLTKGDRVAVIAANSIEWPEITYGLAKAGFVLVPVNIRLTPPPVAPRIPSNTEFHTTSASISLPEALSVVPPQPKAFGLLAGKFTEGFPSGEPLSAPESPDETHTVTPTVERFFNTSLIKPMYFGDQLDSCSPQLSESTVGRCFLSASAVVSAW